MTRLVLVSHSLAGHRREYVGLFARLCDTSGASWQLARHWQDVLAEPAPVLFLMIEESFSGYLVAGLARAFRGHRTVGLLFRGAEAATGGTTNTRLKGAILTLLKRVVRIQTLAITPFSAEPALARVADGWIYDPQLWDLTDDTVDPTALTEAVRSSASGRAVVVALGAQNAGKGFDAFCRLWVDSEALRARYLFVSAGKVVPELAAEATAFQRAGGMLVDRFVTDEELLGLYGTSDLVWACYSPRYDQASGIFGRAFQFGVPVAVRDGSQVQRMAADLGHPTTGLIWGKDDQMIAALLAAPGRQQRPVDTVRQMKRHSLDVLGRALGVSFTSDAS